MANDRKLTRREFIAAACGAGVLSGCAALDGDQWDAASSSSPSNEWPAPEGGIGGTGVRSVGLVGALTDFGSLRMNGRVVETPPETVYEDAFGAIEPGRLEIGHSLTVEAVRQGSTLVARRVALTQPVIGPVGAIAEGGARLHVLGVAIHVDPSAARPLAIGDRVAVSGVWRGPDVVASRIDAAPAHGADVLAGALAPPDASGTRRIGGGRVILPADAPVETARYMSAAGRWTHAGGRDALQAQTVRYGRFSEGTSISELSVEGYLEPIASAPFFEISGLGHSFDAAAQLAPFADTLTVFDGPYDGDFLAATGTRLPNDFEERRAALRSGAAVRLPVDRR